MDEIGPYLWLALITLLWFMAFKDTRTGPGQWPYDINFGRMVIYGAVLLIVLFITASCTRVSDNQQGRTGAVPRGQHTTFGGERWLV